MSINNKAVLYGIGDPPPRTPVPVLERGNTQFTREGIRGLYRLRVINDQLSGIVKTPSHQPYPPRATCPLECRAALLPSRYHELGERTERAAGERGGERLDRLSANVVGGDPERGE